RGQMSWFQGSPRSFRAKEPFVDTERRIYHALKRKMRLHMRAGASPQRRAFILPQAYGIGDGFGEGLRICWWNAPTGTLGVGHMWRRQDGFGHRAKIGDDYGRSQGLRFDCRTSEGFRLGRWHRYGIGGQECRRHIGAMADALHSSGEIMGKDQLIKITHV